MHACLAFFFLLSRGCSAVVRRINGMNFGDAAGIWGNGGSADLGGSGIIGMENVAIFFVGVVVED